MVLVHAFSFFVMLTLLRPLMENVCCSENCSTDHSNGGANTIFI